MIELLKYAPVVLLGVFGLQVLLGPTPEFMVACVVFGVFLGVYKGLGEE